MSAISRFRLPVSHAILLVLVSLSLASPAERKVDKVDDAVVEQWLSGPERHDFGCKIELNKPTLTYQQRYLVRVLSTVEAREAMKAGDSPDLHFFVKIGNERGEWFPGYKEEHPTLPPKLGKKDQVESKASVLLRPGQYVIGIAIADSAHGRLHIWKRHLSIPALKHDPLPELDRDLPAAEFVTPANELLADSPTAFDKHANPHARATNLSAFSAAQPRDNFTGRRRRMGAGADEDLSPVAPAAEVVETGDPWVLGHGWARLPVANVRPVRVDVVMNFSPGYTYAGQNSEASLWAYRINTGLMLQVGNLLSQLGLQHGCVRVSALDVMRMNVVADRVSAARFDWDKLRLQLAKDNVSTIDVATLQGRTQSSEFLRRFIQDLVSDSTSCAPQNEPAVHVVVMTSTGMLFPHGTLIQMVNPHNIPEVHFYYIRPLVRAGDAFDQIQNVVQTLKPHRFTPPDPKHFRDAVAQIISDLNNLPGDTQAEIKNPKIH